MATGRIIQPGGPRVGGPRPRASYIHVRTIANSNKTNSTLLHKHTDTSPTPLHTLSQACGAPTRVAWSVQLCAWNTRTTELFHEI